MSFEFETPEIETGNEFFWFDLFTSLTRMTDQVMDQLANVKLSDSVDINSLLETEGALYASQRASRENYYETYETIDEYTNSARFDALAIWASSNGVNLFLKFVLPHLPVKGWVAFDTVSPGPWMLDVEGNLDNIGGYYLSFLVSALEAMVNRGIAYPAHMTALEWKNTLQSMVDGFRVLVDDGFPVAFGVNYLPPEASNAIGTLQRVFPNLWD